jgi:hypothetical protein
MRLLAATSPEAEGSLTEADEVVGEISAGGTLSLIASPLSGCLQESCRDCSTRWCAQRCRPVVRAA